MGAATTTAPDIKVVELDLIDIPEEYQRTFDSNRSARMAEQFEPAICGTLLVNRRGDRYVVVDGQHRLAAMRLCGYQAWPCVVADAETIESEARQFAQTNTSQKRLTAWAIFRARLVGNDPIVTGIKAVCDSLGITISDSSHASGRSTRAVAALERVFRSGGADHLANVIRIASSSWPGRNLDQDILLGLSSFLVYYEDDQNFDRERAIEKFSRLSLEEVRQRARVLSPSSGNSGARLGDSRTTFGVAPGVVRALVEAYNWRVRSNGLSEPTLSGWKRVNQRRAAS